MNRSANEPGRGVPVGEKLFLSPPPPSIEEPDLREVFSRLWRRKGWIVGTVISVMVLTVAILFHLIPLYTAQTIILIESGGDTLVALSTDPDSRSPKELHEDTQAVQGEIEIIRSRGLAEKLIDRLNLHIDDAPWLKDLLAEVFGWSRAEERSGEETDTREQVRQVDAFLDNLDISQREKSRAIAVKFTHDNPETSALVANTLAELYIVDQLKAKSEAIQRANVWLSKTVASFQEKVETSERAVEDFRKNSGLLEGNNTTFAAQQLAELDNQLIQTRIERADAERRLNHAKELINSTQDVDFAADVLQSPLIQKLREEEMLSERKLAELSRQYHIAHPESAYFKAQVRDLQAAIKAEVEAIIKSLENEVALAQKRESSLQKNVAGIKVQVAEANTEQLRLRALEREAQANRLLSETFLSRFKETNSHVDIDSVKANARIISRADPPIDPSFPKYKLILPLAFAGSIFIGSLLAFIVEQLDPGFRSGEQIEQATGLPVLSLVPRLGRFTKANEAPESYISKHPVSPFGASIRSLYTSIHFSKLDPPKTILITSAEPDEGKTAIAICLAKMQALGSRKVVIVDTDFRRPGVHRAFGLPRQPGLVEFLTGAASLKEVCQKDEASGITVVPSGASVPNPPEFLASDQLNRLLDALAQHYDLVVLDSPPLMAVSDARILSTKVDTTIFVVHWAHTRREVVVLALKQITMTGGHLAGVVLSMVDPTKHARYSFGDSGYYSKNIKKYYAS